MTLFRSRTLKSPKCVFVLLVIGCAGAWLYGAWHSVPPSALPPEYEEIKGLAVKQRDLDLGTVWEDDNLHYQLPIENRTGSDIRVKELIPSCWCLDVKPRSLVIPAGKTYQVDITLDLTHRVPGEIGLAEREFTVEITPVFESGMPRVRGWALHGVSKSRMTLDILSVDFREATVRGQLPVPRKVLATIHVPVDHLEVTADPSVAKVNVERHKSRADTFELSVSWSNSLPVGPFNTHAVIDLISPEGERLRGATLPIAGRMKPEVRILPSRLILGSKPIEEKLEAIVVLQAPANAAIVIDHIETDSRALHVEPVAIEGIARGRTYKVIQKVSKEGDQSSLVRFFIKSEKPTAPLEMQVCYRGEAQTEVQHNGAKPR